MIQPFYLAGAIKDLSLDPFIHVFMVMIIIDLLSGLAKAIKLKVANSSIGLNGLIRHAIIIFIVMMMSVYLPIFGLEKYVSWIIGYFIFQYLISVIENLGAIGVPLPKGLKETIYKLNDTIDETINGKLLKIDTMVVNKHETIESKDVNKNG